jgi:riboflavin biosynthesis pyrimidine reductase
MQRRPVHQEERFTRRLPLFGRFVTDGCVDELFLTVAPQVAGRNKQPPRPGFIAGVEFLPGTAPWLDIISVKARGNHLYLRYVAA